MTDQPLPLTVVTGYLGAGKTTLLNTLLTQNHGRRYAVIVNEFGEIGIDGMLFDAVDDDLFEMNNGCVCCTVRGDLSEALERILSERSGFDGVILETSGLAQPAPIIQTLMMDESLRNRVVMDSVVTVVDMPTLMSGRVFEPAQSEQIAFADVIVVSKTDTVDNVLTSEIEVPLRVVNGHAQIVQSGGQQAPIDAIVGLAGFDPARRIGTGPRSAHAHDDTITSVSLRLDSPLDSNLFMDWIGQVVGSSAETLLRLKGVIRMRGEDRPFVIQGVRNILDGGFKPISKHSDLGAEESCLVFIGRNLDETALQNGFAACRA